VFLRDFGEERRERSLRHHADRARLGNKIVDLVSDAFGIGGDGHGAEAGAGEPCQQELRRVVHVKQNPQPGGHTSRRKPCRDPAGQSLELGIAERLRSPLEWRPDEEGLVRYSFRPVGEKSGYGSAGNGKELARRHLIIIALHVQNVTSKRPLQFLKLIQQL
jgi:hypothetical protein